MNGEVNKFSLVAYEKDNLNNIKVLDFTKTENNKSFLSSIDMYTSRYIQYDFYSKLLEKGIITKEQTEFVIWYKEKDIIKQFPVIFNDSKIRVYSEYLNNQTDEEHKKEFDKLNSNVFWEFIKKVDKDSEIYDKLSDEEKENYMISNTFSARFSRMPFALSSFKERVKNRIVGVKEDYKNPDSKVSKDKTNKNYRSNFSNIKTDIETSYRCFRDVYLYLKTNSNYETTHMDLSYDDIFNKKEIIYTVSDFIELARNNEFNDFVWNCNLVTKKVKEATNKINKSFFDSEVDSSLERIIIDFSNKNPGIINQIIHQYKSTQKQA